jgi:hypothetical protein
MRQIRGGIEITVEAFSLAEGDVDVQSGQPLEWRMSIVE